MFLVFDTISAHRYYSRRQLLFFTLSVPWYAKEYKITVLASSPADFILRTFFITHFILIMIVFYVFVLSFFVFVENKTLTNISKDYDDTHGKSTFANYCVYYLIFK
jgi:hypothetical protein